MPTQAAEDAELDALPAADPDLERVVGPRQFLLQDGDDDVLGPSSLEDDDEASSDDVAYVAKAVVTPPRATGE